ncbi:Histone chaperone asf1, partial [Bonamia ostreae]
YNIKANFAMIDLKKITLVNENQIKYRDPFLLHLELHCYEPGLPPNSTIIFDISFVSPSNEKEFEQKLGKFEIGSIRTGFNTFDLKVEGPDHSIVPEVDRFDISALIISCSYLDQEFVRVGYFVSFYVAEEMKEQIETMEKISVEDVRRKILENDVRVTRFSIDWNKSKLANSEKLDNAKSFDGKLGENSNLVNNMEDE